MEPGSLPDKEFLKSLFQTHQEDEDALLKSLFQHLPQLENLHFFYMDLTRRRDCIVQDSICDLVGLSSQDFVKGGPEFFVSLVHPGDLPYYIQEQVRQYHLTLSSDFNRKNPYLIFYELRYRHRERSWIRLNSRIVILGYTPQRKYQQSLGVMQDVSLFEPFPEMPSQRAKNRKVDRFLKNIQQLYVEFFPDHFVCASEDSPQGLTKILTPRASRPHVSAREKEVLALIAQGNSSREVAALLNISFHTAESHRKHLLKKFDARNSAELVKKASKIYWLE